jgi:glycosyltransferase involved in cell wall biosynthesis
VHISCSVFVSRYDNRGIFKRIYNTVEAAFKQKDINHITGDVNFLCYFMKKRRTILTVLDCGFFITARGLKKFAFWLFWFYVPLKKVAYVTVISDATKSELLKLVDIDPGKIRVIPCCISPLYKYVPRPFNHIYPRILQVGTVANKNILRLFEALKGIECEVIIIGRLSVEQLAILSKFQIVYTNYWEVSDEEMVNMFRMCDMVTFVSIYEGFGMPILEANATGRPVLTSNILSMPEVAGDAACIVDPYSVDEIRSGICHIISDQEYRDQLVQNGLRNILRYTPERVALQYAKLYQEVLDS